MFHAEYWVDNHKTADRLKQSETIRNPNLSLSPPRRFEQMVIMSAEIDPEADTDVEFDRKPETTVRLSKDDAFHLLQNARRRAVLRYMLEQDEQDRFVMRDIAEAVAAWEHDTTVRQLSSDERQRVYIALYQNHLPKLAEMGVIEYNQSRGHVTPKPAITLLDPFLEDSFEVDTDLSLEWEGSDDSPLRVPLLTSLLS